MSIELDTTRLAAATQTFVGDSAPLAKQSKVLAALLGGPSVTVTSGVTGDLEALVAKLKGENERTRFSLLLTSLASIGQSMTEAQ